MSFLFRSVIGSGEGQAQSGTQTSQRPDAGLAEQCASCGNTFMSDSKYCRKCGKIRPSLSSSSECNDKIAVVAKAVREAEAEPPPDQDCLDMLGNAVKDSIGPKKVDRDEFQNKTGEIIGETLKKNQKLLQKRRDAAKKELDRLKVELDKRIQAVNQAKEAVDDKKKKIAEAQRILDDALSRCEKARRDVAKAEDELKDAQTKLDALKGKKMKWDDIWEKHFVPLKVMETYDKKFVDGHLEVLKPLLEDEWGKVYEIRDYEECLLETFYAACEYGVKKREQCKWCMKAFIRVEELRMQPLAKLDKQIADATDVVNKCQEVLDEATKRRSKICDQEVPRAQKGLKDAEEALNVALKQLKDAEAARDDAENKVEQANKKYLEAEDELKSFNDIVWAAYMWLLSEKNDGNYDNRTYKDPEPGKHYPKPIPGKIYNVQTEGILKAPLDDPQYEALLTTATGAAPIPGASRSSKEMLKNFLPLSGGPPKSGRCPDCQEVGNDMIEQVLQSYIKILQKKIEEAEKDLRDAKKKEEKALNDRNKKREDCNRAKAKREEKEKAYNHWVSECDKAKKELQKATEEWQDAEEIVNGLQEKLNAWQDAYDKHFIPIWKLDPAQTNVPNEYHVRTLLPLFYEWGHKSLEELVEEHKLESPPPSQEELSKYTEFGFEACLIATFKAASKYEPDQRCDWCEKVFKEINRLCLKQKETAAAGSWRLKSIEKAPIDEDDDKRPGPFATLEQQLKVAEEKRDLKKKVMDQKKGAMDEVCGKKVPKASKELQEAEDEVNKLCGELLKRAEEALSLATQAREQADIDLADAKNAKKKFEDSVWQDFQYLRKHEEPKLT